MQTSRRQELINLIKDQWGHDKVAQIATFGSLQAKSIVQAVGKVLDVPRATIDKIKMYIPDGMSVEEAITQSSELQSMKVELPVLFDYSIKLEGLERSISTHAGGIVITPSHLRMSDFCGLAISKGREEITQLEMHNVEEVGLVKMDLLGLSTLDVINDTLLMISKGGGGLVD